MGGVLLFVVIKMSSVSCFDSRAEVVEAGRLEAARHEPAWVFGAGGDDARTTSPDSRASPCAPDCVSSRGFEQIEHRKCAPFLSG